jgi:hypothetical protein
MRGVLHEISPDLPLQKTLSQAIGLLLDASDGIGGLLDI